MSLAPYLLWPFDAPLVCLCSKFSHMGNIRPCIKPLLAFFPQRGLWLEECIASRLQFFDAS
uniref:Uncharacterized protein n=1 Tax=Rhizophora mucronata TaxID=61149 RepID=A0A2P2NBU7_RHIMU